MVILVSKMLTIIMFENLNFYRQYMIFMYKLTYFLNPSN